MTASRRNQNHNRNSKKTQQNSKQQQKQKLSSSSSTSTSTSTSDDSKTTNRPRNLLVIDATKPYTFTYTQYGKPASITINQTPDEETWPGGALWDIGVLLSHVLVGITAPTKGLTVPSQLLQAFPSSSASTYKDWTVLELGCGVGLTGLVAAAALGTKLTILTDLKVVVDQVTHPNLELNTTVTAISSSGIANGGKKKKDQQQQQHQPSSSSSAADIVLTRRLMNTGKRGRVIAMPLCWGNQIDEDAVQEVLKLSINHSNKSQQKSRRKKQQKKQANKIKNKKNVIITSSDKIDGIDDKDSSCIDKDEEATTNNTTISIPSDCCEDNDDDRCYPDLIVIGDVAYQHKPGAPSHFDALVSTVRKFLGPSTRVLFGTRMRMPASSDLLDLFHTIMEEVVVPPTRADEIDSSSFGTLKHQITIHVFKKKAK